MVSSALVVALLAPAMVVAAPAITYEHKAIEASRIISSPHAISARQAVVTPEPCVESDVEPSEEENSAMFDKFVIAFLVHHNLTETFEYINEEYIQHNPYATDGANNALDFLTPLWPNVQNQILSKLYANGTGIVHHRQDDARAPQPSAIMDKWRLKGGCIVEHWDVIQERPANSTNPHAMF